MYHWLWIIGKVGIWSVPSGPHPSAKKLVVLISRPAMIVFSDERTSLSGEPLIHAAELVHNTAQPCRTLNILGHYDVLVALG